MSDLHVETAAHREAPEIVDHRQRLGIWLFIAGDAIATGALIFTYLYLRAVNTNGRWMSIVGLPANGRSASTLQGILDNGGSMINNVEAPLSAGFSWLLVAVLAVCVGLYWLGEARLRSSASGRSAFIALSVLAGVGLIAYIVLSIVQLRHVPQYWRAENDSKLFVYTTYGSCMLALGVSAIIHAIILAFLSFGSATRAAVGVLSHEKWYQARLIRYFSVWVAIASVLLTLVVTSLNIN